MNKLLCSHNYEIIKEHVMKSQLQIMLENGLLTFETRTTLIYHSKYVIIYKCKKCNKIKKTIIKLLDDE